MLEGKRMLSKKDKIEKAKELMTELKLLKLQEDELSNNTARLSNPVLCPLACGNCPSAGDVIESCSIERRISH